MNATHPLAHSASPRRRKGFTLIELVITMVVAAMLAAIAIPAYSTYVRKSRRAEAKSALLDLAALEERYFSTQNVYTPTATDLGYASWPANIGNGYYQVATPTVTTAGAPTSTTPGGTPATYSFTASPVGDQVKDTQCTSFTVSSGGVQTATPSAASATCWR